MKKRLLAFLLALTMVLSMAPAAFAADEAAAETTVEAAQAEPAAEAAEPAAPAETSAESAATQETLAEPAAEPAQAEPAAEEPVALAEEPVFDLARNGDPDCYCGGWHNGEYGHVCEAVEWTDVTAANKATYWTGAAVEETIGKAVHLRLQEDITVSKTLYIGKSQAPDLNAGTVLTIDLNGHTLTQTGGRVGNVYAGTTFNICDSSAEHTGKVVSSASNGTASTIATWGGPTESNPTNINLWGGTITNTKAQAVPAFCFNTTYSILNVYEGAELTGFTNTTATAGNPSSVSTLIVRPSVLAITGTGSGVNMYGGKITNCQTGSQGGAIAMRATSVTGGFINLEAGEISGCTSGFHGGAIFMQNGTLTIHDGMTIRDNTVTIGTTDAEKIRANCYGGAIYKDNGILEMDGGVISGNKSGNGGAMYLFKGVNTISGGTISGNVADGRFESSNGVPNNNCNSYGGAIYYDGSTTEGYTLDITGGTFTGNESSAGGGGLRLNGLGATISGGVITGNVARTTDGGAIYIAGSGTVVDITGGDIYGNTTQRTQNDVFRVAGITIRNNPTVNFSGSVKIHDNVSAIGNTESNVSTAAVTGLRTVNVGELTDDAYFTITGALNEAKCTLNDAGLTQTTKHVKDMDVAYFGPAYTSNADVSDYDLTLDFTTGTTYAVGDLLSYDVYAKIADDATVDEAFLQSVMAKVTTSGTGELTVNDVTVNNAYNGESISLFMWADDTLTAPMKLTKTAQKIGTVYGTPAAEGTVNITTEIEFATTATKTPVTKQAQQDITIGQKVEHNHCYCGGNCTAEGHAHDTTAHEWVAINASNVDQYFSAAVLGNDGDELYFFLNSDITITKRMYVGDSAGTANGAASSVADVTIHLCLNGHTISVAGDCAFGLNSGKLTICDCSEEQTGKVIAVAKTTTGNPQAGRIFFVPNISANAEGSRNIVEVYGGTYTQAADTTRTSHGLVYLARDVIFRVYGGVFDGNNVAPTTTVNPDPSKSNVISGIIYATGAEELGIYGGTFQNGYATANTNGGAIYAIRTNLIVKNATFQNNHTDDTGASAGAIYDNAGNGDISKTSTYENVTFINNTVGDRVRNVTLAPGIKTLDNSDFGVLKVGGSVVVTLPATQKIDRAYSLSEGAEITFEGAEDGTVLSTDDRTNNFTDKDASYIKLMLSSATAVKCDEGALVAVTEGESTISWATTEFVKDFDGKAYEFTAEDTTVTGSTGKVTYTYYAAADSEEAIAAPTEAGTYYVTATVAADLRHPAATTATRATVTINALAEHKHCICGGSYEGHAHEDVVWTPVNQANVGSVFSGSHNVGGNQYYYLTEDVTVSTNAIIGHKTTGEFTNVYLDLNGKTMTSTGTRVFDMRNGTATVCDCVGTGKIIANPDETKIQSNGGKPSAGSIVFWQGSTYGIPDVSVFNMYGGTFENAEDLDNPSSHGFFYCTNGGTVNIYDGTFDGKEVKGAFNPSGETANNGAGLLSGYNATINLYGGTFVNGSAYTYGGAIWVSGQSTLNIYDAKFANNVAPSRGNNIFVNASTFNSAIEIEDVDFGGASTIACDIPANSEIALTSANSSITIGEHTIGAGTVIDLNGGALNINGTTVVDLTVKSSTEGGKITFSDTMEKTDIDSIIGAIAANNAKLDAAERVLPLLSDAEKNEYTLYQLEAAALICPQVQLDTEKEAYKFRMMPRFVSQDAYDLLKDADGALTIGFTVSADGGAEQSFDFSAEDVKNYFGSAKDKYAFYVYLAGLTTGQVVTLKPYFKIGDQVVYQGTQAPEIVTYTVG